MVGPTPPATPPAAAAPERHGGLLVIGGDGPPPGILARLAADAGFTVAADSGLDGCIAAGVVPDLVVGDMDSL